MDGLASTPRTWWPLLRPHSRRTYQWRLSGALSARWYQGPVRCRDASALSSSVHNWGERTGEPAAKKERASDSVMVASVFSTATRVLKERPLSQIQNRYSRIRA